MRAAAARQASAPGPLSTCPAPTSLPNYLALLHKTTFGTRNKTVTVQGGLGATGAFQGLQEFSEVTGAHDTIVYVPSTSLGWAGALSSCSGHSHVQGGYSTFPDTSPEPILALNKGSSRINRPSTCPWPPLLEQLQLVVLCPRRSRHLLGSCWPAQTTQHTAFTEAAST